ncbi:MAG: hypothetical protein MZW92_11045 [Comamonadaceae bacterium]|nr:hypothetical protein [Comamonadaceae bacterium]
MSLGIATAWGLIAGLWLVLAVRRSGSRRPGAGLRRGTRGGSAISSASAFRTASSWSKSASAAA